MNGPVICTIAAANYLPFVRVLARSLAETNPVLPFRFLLATNSPERAGASIPGLDLLTPATLTDPRLAGMWRRYGKKAYCAALKPFLLSHLLDGGHGTVLFLDPDILVTASLAPLIDTIARHPLTLCPHLHQPREPLGHDATERTLLTSGQYNAGCIGVTDHPDSRAFLNWWAERLSTHCIGAPASGYHYDQRWLDLAPGFVPGLHLMRDPGCNLGHWNIDSHQITGDAPSLRIDGKRLRFFHFSGFDPARPGQLSQFAPDRSVIGTPLQPLFEDYAAKLRAEGCATTLRSNRFQRLAKRLLRRMTRTLR